jgi:hypothetical protein
MNVEKMDEMFAAGLRELLVEQVRARPRATPRWGRSGRLVPAIAAACVLAVGGGGLAYATGAFTGPPGGQTLTYLSPTVNVTGTGTQTVQLGPHPQGANSIRMIFTCLTSGEFHFADGAGVTCSLADPRPSRRATSVYTMAIAPRQDTTTIKAGPHAHWRLVVRYVRAKTTAWGVNASGQTYGVPNHSGTPDLIAVIATNHRHGYAFAAKLDDGPTRRTAEDSVAGPRR